MQNSCGFARWTKFHPVNQYGYGFEFIPAARMQISTTANLTSKKSIALSASYVS